MRITLELDDDVHEAVRSLARAERRSQGSVLSDLARQALAPPVHLGPGRAGFPTFQVEGGGPITLEQVNAALEDG